MKKLMFSLGVCLTAAIFCSAQSIAPDKTFNSTGFLQANTGFMDNGSAIVVQRDHKIVVAGTSASRTLTLMRYDFDGALDETFGDAGITKIEFAEPVYVRSIVIDSKNRVIVGGYVGDASYDAFVLRTLIDGTIDKTFSADIATPGIFIWNASVADKINDIAIGKDDDIIAAGVSESKIAVWKLTNAGLTESEFGSNNGYVIKDLIGSDLESVNSVAVDTINGEIVLGGTANQVASDFFVSKLDLETGAPLNQFSLDGFQYLDLSENDEVSDILLLPNREIVIAGKSNSGSRYDFTVAKYSPDGNLVTTFGDKGIVTTSFGENLDEIPHSIGVQENGKLVVGGWLSGGTNNAYILTRYTTAGALDPDFGSSGRYTVPLQTGVVPEQMVLDSLRIYMVGTTTDFDFSIVALTNNEMALPSTLQSIDARRISNGINISWSTTNEVNVSHYIVERSIDGRSFSRIASLYAHNSVAFNSYSYNDFQVPAGKLFYRLIVVDFDGHKTISKTISAQYDAPANLEVMGSPSSSTIIVRIDGSCRQLAIRDVLGRPIRIIKIDKMMPSLLPIDISALSPGIYTISDGTRSERFIRL